MDDDMTPMRQFWEVIGVYTQDVAACLTALEAAEQSGSASTAMWRRLLANAILTVINAVPFRLMIYSEIRKAEGDKEKLLQRLTQLAAQSEQGNLTGSATEGGGLVKAIRISFQSYAELHHTKYALKISHEDVTLLNKIGTINLTMKLARKPSDLEISDDQLELLYKGVAWIKTHWIDLLNSCGQRMLLDDSIPYVM